MKKVIKVLGAAIFAAALFLNSSSAMVAEDFDLVGLTSLNSADAECILKEYWPGWRCNMYNECELWGNYNICTPN